MVGFGFCLVSFGRNQIICREGNIARNSFQTIQKGVWSV